MNSDSKPFRGSYAYGLLMTAVTMVLWAIQPFFMKVALLEFSSLFVSWFRLSFAFCLLLLIQLIRKPFSEVIPQKIPPFLAVCAGIGLGLNYWGYIEGVRLSGPTNTQILIQLGPILLTLIGVFFYGEYLHRKQAIGLAIAVLGFSMFYLEKYLGSSDSSLYTTASSYVIFAAFAWTFYGVAQKSLKLRFSAPYINLNVYFFGALTLLPVTSVGELTGLISISGLTVLILGFSTFIAYGSLAEAIRCVPLPIVSVLVALNPLLTLILVVVFETIGITWMDSGLLGLTGYLGAFSAMAGVILVISTNTARQLKA